MVMMRPLPMLSGAEVMPGSGERRVMTTPPLAGKAPGTWVQQFQRQLSGAGQALPNFPADVWEGDGVVLQQPQDSLVFAEDNGAQENDADTEPPSREAVNENAVVVTQPAEGEAVSTFANHPVSGPLSSQLVALIEQHVTQWLVSAEARHIGESGQVVLQLGEHLLAGAQLTLVRQSGGWTLKAQADTRMLTAIKRAERQLMLRFASAGLGTLTLVGSRDDQAEDG